MRRAEKFPNKSRASGSLFLAPVEFGDTETEFDGDIEALRTHCLRHFACRSKTLYTFENAHFTSME